MIDFVNKNTIYDYVYFCMARHLKLFKSILRMIELWTKKFICYIISKNIP